MMKIRWAMGGVTVGLFVAAYAADPSVTVHSVAQRAGTKLVDISYSATDADGDDLNVTISVKDGSTVVDSFSGSEGANQTVSWNAGAVWSNSVGSLTFHVVADDTQILGKLLVVGNQHSFGVVGKYFNFWNDDLNAILGRTNWTDQFLKVQNNRTKQIGWVVVWDTPNGGELGNGHGRWTYDYHPSAGQWLVGDWITIFE